MDRKTPPVDAPTKMVLGIIEHHLHVGDSAAHAGGADGPGFHAVERVGGVLGEGGRSREGNGQESHKGDAHGEAVRSHRRGFEGFGVVAKSVAVVWSSASWALRGCRQTRLTNRIP